MKVSNNKKWEVFANDNAEYYVDTKILDYPVEERKERFFKSGQKFTSMTLGWVEDLLPDNKRALEIGAGVGRLTLPHANTFAEVIAVDISQTMLEKLNINAQDTHLDGIKTFLPEGEWDEQKVSYAYSYLVFQHIEDPEVIESYIKRIAGCLKNNGIAQLQFDTRPQSIWYKLRNIIPDFLLPKKQKRVSEEYGKMLNIYGVYSPNMNSR